MSFIDRLEAAWRRADSLLCVGLDPDLSRLPARYARTADGLFDFCCTVAEATHDLVCAFKPQIAHFAAQGAEAQLADLIAHLHERYPDVPVILDAKRGDIGSTAERYAEEAFVRHGADAVTVNPYLGGDSIQPFLNYADRGVIVLCRTSNAGAADFQEALIDGVPLYEHIAGCAAREWNAHRNCLLVVGATWPDAMRRIRERTGDMPFLVPGVGAQGAGIADVVRAGQTAAGTGLVICASRSVLYAGSGDDHAQAARVVAMELRAGINRHR